MQSASKYGCRQSRLKVNHLFKIYFQDSVEHNITQEYTFISYKAIICHIPKDK